MLKITLIIFVIYLFMRRKRMPIELEFKTRLSKRPDNIRKKKKLK